MRGEAEGAKRRILEWLWLRSEMAKGERCNAVAKNLKGSTKIPKRHCERSPGPRVGGLPLRTA